MMHPLLERHRTQILALAASYGIFNVRVFGSMARGDHTPASDVDLLVSVEEGRSGLVLGGLLMDVQALLGRPVDIVTDEGLHPMLRERVLAEAIAL